MKSIGNVFMDHIILIFMIKTGIQLWLKIGFTKIMRIIKLKSKDLSLKLKIQLNP